MSRHRLLQRYLRPGLSAAVIVLLLYFILRDDASRFASPDQSALLTRNRTYPRSPITVVTAYYYLPSRHAYSEYLAWMDNFLNHIPCHLYIFTHHTMLDIIVSKRRSFLRDRTRFIVRELEELEEYSNMTVYQKLRDNENRDTAHSAENYVIWNQKWRFVLEAMEENVFQSEYFLWVDIGSFRDRSLLYPQRSFPSIDSVQSLAPKDKLTLLLVYPFVANASDWWEDITADHVGAGIAGGYPHAWRQWIEKYYETQRVLLTRGVNAGKEQNVMNAVARRYPETVHLVTPQPYFGDRWFYLQYYFA
ncbi:uncharacterized protein LOC129596027 [Paramacrobiotus metropolitanus]|uniref:uncharacterized protein LOC129596027 n=1 Tax=Paramacrobiotus metropolitanus TaxID=2943436 RepID=UPI002445F5C0|nr:uncharacterized protein LOC129596027 [Paramacrobiotus metropolitanus]